MEGQPQRDARADGPGERKGVRSESLQGGLHGDRACRERGVLGVEDEQALGECPIQEESATKEVPRSVLPIVFFQEDVDAVVAYGAAKFNPTGKGEQAVPTTQVSKACKRHLRTEFVDEYRTTKVCCGCDAELQSVKALEEREGRRIRGLRRCCSTECRNSQLKNRDANAALNIRRCLTNNRPAALQRECPASGSGTPLSQASTPSLTGEVL